MKNSIPRGLNSVVRALHLHRLACPLKVDEVVASAMRATELDDLGDSDWQEPLEVLLEDYQRSAKLTELGQFVAARLVVGFLSNRLRVVDRSKKNSIVPIEAPVFILGLPRTGSTLLHELLASHSAFGAPLFWESESLPSNSWKDALRVAKSRTNIGLLLAMVPQFRNIHPLGARRPHECITIQGISLRTTQLNAIHRLPGYTRWLQDCDWQPAYAWHSLYLSLLQGLHPNRRWILKAPGHMQSIDALLKQYPDARFIQLHRHPKETVPSMASLYATLRTTSSAEIDMSEIGRGIVNEWGRAVNLVMQARNSSEIDAKFIDLHYRTLIDDPLASAQQIFDFVGAPIAERDRAQMLHYLQHQVRPKGRQHKYGLEQFGLSEKIVEDAFADYISQNFTKT